MIENLKSLWTNITENAGMFLLFIALIAVFFAAAEISERVICKKNNIDRRNESFKINRMAIIAVMAVIAIVFNLFGFPLWFIPGFYKIDISELPVVIGAYAMGPTAGVMIEFLKILLNLLINGTQTAFVGELANFLIGCAFVVPASIIYYRKKSRKSAVAGLGCGIVVNGITGALLNAYLLLPVYAKVFFKADSLDLIIGMGTEKNSLISGLTSFIIWAVVPFNFIKCLLVMIITLLIYKPISHLIKK